MRYAAIFLCSKTPTMAVPWAASGVECWCVDVQHSIRKPLQVGMINFAWGDVRSWRPPEGLTILFVAAFPPCTHTAVSGARDFVTKGGVMLRDALETFEACRAVAAWSGAPFCIEQPYRTGQRIDDVLHVQDRDINEEGVYVQQGKTGS